MAHRIWKETKQELGTDGPGKLLGCCLVSFHFLWAILYSPKPTLDAKLAAGEKETCGTEPPPPELGIRAAARGGADSEAAEVVEVVRGRGGLVVGEGEVEGDAGMNCIKIGLPGKLILSKWKGLL